MRTIKLTLKGNLRLLNKGTMEITYTPNSPIQLILGNNGYGKSTVLEELSVLPANAKDYINGGLKHHIVEHRGHTYELTSDFSKGSGHHSLTKDGVVLTDAVNASVQKQYIEKEFGYTQDIHKLLLGKVKFTQLTAKNRKDFFTQICPSDITYAMHTFKQAQQLRRDAQGALHHTNTKLSEYVALMLSDDEVNELNGLLTQCSEQIRQLSEYKYPHVNQGYDPTRREQLKAAIEDIAGKLLKHTPPHPVHGVRLEKDKSHLTYLQGEVKALVNEMDLLKQEHQRIDELLGNHLIEGKDKQTLTNELHEARQAHQAIIDEVGVIHPEPQHAIHSLDSIKDGLIKLFASIDANTNKKVYNRQVEAQLKARIDELRSKHNKAVAKQTALQKQLVHIESHSQQVECPSCHTSFDPYLDKQSMASITQQIEKIDVFILDNDKALQETITQHEALEQWKGLHQQFMSYVSAYSTLKGLFDQCLEDDLFYNNPTACQHLVNRYTAYLQRCSKAKQYSQDIDALTHALGLVDAQQTQSREALVNRKTQIDNQLAYQLDELANRRHTVKQWEQRLGYVHQQLSQLGQLTQQLDELETLLINHEQSEFNQQVDNQINALSERSAMLTNKINKSSHYASLYHEYEQSVDKLKNDIQGYDRLIHKLSPTHGLIAESLGGFINAFIGHMNDVISKIWTTPLQVLPCISQDGDLDYKFPIQTYKDDYNGKDISQGSVGEMEVIDYAFMLAARAYLQVDDYPLYMDEVGHHFSELHRANLYNYIKMLVGARRIDQVFIISHFPSTHGSLTHADINYIDPTGVAVHEGMNEHFNVS